MCIRDSPGTAKNLNLGPHVDVTDGPQSHLLTPAGIFYGMSVMPHTDTA